MPDTAQAGRADTGESGKQPAMSPKERARGLNDIAALKDGHAAKVEEMEAAKHAMDKYKTIGPSQALVKNQMFEYLTLTIIAFNGIWIGYDVDKNKDDIVEAKLLFQCMENFFCFYFTFEVGVRFLAYHTKWDCRRDGWFVFDSTLVTFMVIETWLVLLFSAGLSGFSILRLLRLARLARMARLMRAFPDLVILIKGMGAATRTVGSTLFLLVIFMYVFAIIFTQQLRPLCGKYDYPDTRVCLEPCSASPECIAANPDDWDTVAGPWMVWNWDQPMFPELLMNEECVAAGECDTWGIEYNPWETVPVSMYSLFLAGTLCDDATFVTQQFLPGSIPGYKGNLAMLMVYYLYVLLSSFTVLNMLIGVLCEVVSQTAAGEKEKAVVSEVAEQIESVFQEIDTDGSGMISKVEFEKLTQNDTVLKALKDLDIEGKHLLALSDTLFEADPDNPEGDPPELIKPQAPPRKSKIAPSLQNLAAGDLGGKPDAVPGGAELDGEELQDGGKELSFYDFLEVVCHHRPETRASVMDIAEVRKMMRRVLRNVEDQIDQINYRVSEHFSPADSTDHVVALKRLHDIALELRDKVRTETDRATAAEARVAELERELAMMRK